MNRFAKLFQFSGGIPVSQASFGDAARAVLRKRRWFQKQIEENAQNFFWGANGQPSEAERFEQSRLAAAQFVGADPEGFVLTPNSATAWSSVFNSLENQLLRGKLSLGDKILITNHAYGNCRAAIDLLVQENGLELAIVDVPFPCKSGQVVVDAFAKTIEKAGPDVIKFAVFDHIPSFPSFIYPVKEIQQLLKSNDVISLIDGTHVPGQIPLNITDLQPDFYISGLSKWAYVPISVSSLYVAPQHRSIIRPAISSEGCKSDNFVERFKWLGTADRSAELCLPMAIKYMAKLFQNGWEGLYEHNHDLAVWGAKHICEQLGIPMPCPEDMIGSLVSIPIGKLQFEPEIEALPPHLRLRSKLLDAGLDVVSAVDKINGQHYLRLTGRVYNSVEDYEKLAKALQSIVAQYRVAPPLGMQMGL